MLLLPLAIPPEPASPASAFIDSVGVNTHWNYPDTPYGSAYEKVRGLLVASGVRHYRTGFSDRVPDLARRGLVALLALDPDPDTKKLVARIKALGAAVDAVEGPNEPDLFWERFERSYKGEGYKGGAAGIADGVYGFQRDLYGALKADPATKRLIVIGPSLGRSYDPPSSNPLGLGRFENAVDMGNIHPYPFGGNSFSQPFPYGGLERYYWHGTFPSVNLDEWPRALEVGRRPFGAKPMAATETGYPTWRGGASETAQAKYVPRLFCEYYRLGIRRTYLYELVDEFEDPEGKDQEAHFGLVRNDLTPKPAYVALRSLMRILADPASTKATPLAMVLKVGANGAFDRTRYVHRLLLQRRNGEYVLLVWHEVSAEDASRSPRPLLTIPTMPATLSLPQGYRVRGVLRYGPDWTLGAVPFGKTPDGARLEVPDTVMVVRIGKG